MKRRWLFPAIWTKRLLDLLPIYTEVKDGKTLSKLSNEFGGIHHRSPLKDRSEFGLYCAGRINDKRGAIAGSKSKITRPKAQPVPSNVVLNDRFSAGNLSLFYRLGTITP